MPFGRSFVAVAVLILIALTCLTIVRRLDRERRLLGRLRSSSLPVDELNADERDTADSLAGAGVLRMERNTCRIDPAALASFRRRRVRLVLVGALAALLVAAIVVISVLIR